MHAFYCHVSRKKYDISHLNKRCVEYVKEATQNNPEHIYKVMVSYSDHCYTKGLDGTNARVFNLERYELSKSLPQIISGLMQRECHHTGGMNFVTLDVKDVGIYEVYFEVFLDKRDGLSLRVQSAYIRDEDKMDNKPSRSKIRFRTILHNVSNKIPIHPPRQKHKRG